MKNKFKSRNIILVSLVLLLITLVSATSLVACGKKNNSTSESTSDGGGKVTLTFVTNGGKDISEITAEVGDEITLPTAEKNDRVFLGWYLSSDFSGEKTTKITLNENASVYARWGVTITFDPSGGTAVDDIVVGEGEKIGALSPSYKAGFVFTGWHYDQTCQKKVSEDDRANNPLTLYAGFSGEAAGTIKKVKNVKNISTSPEIIVRTDGIILHDENSADYLSFKTGGEDDVEFICKPQTENGAEKKNEFVIESANGLTEGEVYFIKTLSSSVKILGVDGNDVEEADEVTVTVFKEEREIIIKNPAKHVRGNKLAGLEEEVYTYIDGGLEKQVNRMVVKTDEIIAEGDILTVGEGEEAADDDYICKVIAAKRETMQYVVGNEIFTDEFLVLDVVTPNADDVYSELDVYGSAKAELEGVIKLSEEEILKNVEENEGIVRLKTAVANALATSSAVTEYADKMPTKKERAEFIEQVSMFSFNRPKVKIDIKGTSLAFGIEIGGEMQIKNFKLAVSVKISNSTSVEYNYTLCKSRKVTLNPLLWFYTDIRVDLSNDFSIGIQASVEFADAADDIHGRIDISEEIQDIIDANKDGQNKFAEAISGSPLWDEEDSELEYVDIFNIPLGQIPIFVPIVSLQLDFNVVGSLGARAGLYIEFSHHYVESATLTNGEAAEGGGKPKMYDGFRFTRATTENELEIDITLKGQVGFRVGLEAKLSLSVLKLNSVAAVYVSFRFGPYVELSGLVNFRYAYDAVNKVSTTSLYGGLYLEAGLFVNAKLGAKFLVYDINTDLFDFKIKLYGVGERLIPRKFTERINSPDDPYVITRRYATIRMSAIRMDYLDIVTGEVVTDNATYNRYGATFDYEAEFYDAPDYQTEDYQKHVRITSGVSVAVSRDYQLKSLKFAVKVRLVEKNGVYASGIERILYMEYFNPAGRDLAVKDSAFMNMYKTGAGTVNDELYRYTFTEGEFVVPPEITEADLPVRAGYYLDMSDLWEKYYPHLGNKVDENWDGTFGKVTYGDYSITFYRLKWKVKTFTAKFYTPEYANADTILNYSFALETKAVFAEDTGYLILLTDKIPIPAINGKKYDGYSSGCGLNFYNDYFTVNGEKPEFKNIGVQSGTYPVVHVDVTSDLYKNGLKGIYGGIEFYANYSDEGVFTETYVLQTETIKRIKAEYKPFDYESGVIRPLPPESFAIGSEFTENGKTYVITGYRDINPADEANCRYYGVDDMPNVDKNRIYYVLFERKGYDELPVYYINIIANGKSIGDYGVKEGEKINLELIKINYDDKTIVGRLTGYPRDKIDEAFGSYKTEWNATGIPAEMPSGDLTINVTATYAYKSLTAEFVITDPLQSFAYGTDYETRANGDRAAVITGKSWTYGSTDDEAFYSFPKLNDYFDMSAKKYYSFAGWKNRYGEVMPYGIRTAFVSSAVYTPVFEERSAKATLYFINYSDYGYEYCYKIISGDYFGKTLKEIIVSEKIADPTRGDESGKSDFGFIDWGVDAEKYVVGSEKDIGGAIKTELTFKARYSEKNQVRKITFDAADGKFADGKSVMTINAEFGEVIDLTKIKPEDYSDGRGEFRFAFWTTVLYSEENRAETSIVVGKDDVTLYAYYLLNPATITLTFKGRVAVDPSDGSGNVYFGGDKTKLKMEVSGLYGSKYYLTANLFAVDSISKSFTPDYLKWTWGGKEYVSEFYNDGYMAEIPFDENAEVEIMFKPAEDRIVNIAFLSDGYCYEEDGTIIDGVYCKGFMSGFKHVINYYEPYGSTVTVPFVDYYSENYYVFDRFESETINGVKPTDKIMVRAGEEITFTDDIVFRAVYVHDKAAKVELTFRSEEYPFGGTARANLIGLMIFGDGSVEIRHYGASGEKIGFNEVPSCKGLKFVGWTTDGKNLVTPSELAQLEYSSKTTYYGVYEEDESAIYTVTLNSGDGSFGGEKTKTLNGVKFGTLAKTLATPVSESENLIFSHYEDENGYPVTAVEKDVTLYACYAKPVSNFKELSAINLALNDNYVLTDDILGNYSEYKEWTAIGYGSQGGFAGTFNGDGHTIRFNARTTSVSGFGLFHKLSGTVYNLYSSCSFSLKGKVSVSSLGAFCGEVAASGRIIDCGSFFGSDVAVSTNRKLNVAGAIGVNNGLIDGLMAGMRGTLSVESDSLVMVGGVVGENRGIIKNVNLSGRSGALNLSLAKSLNCYVGYLVGVNDGEIYNSFSERAIWISLSQGDNIYLENSIVIGSFAGKNNGKTENCITSADILEYSVENLTLGKEGLYVTENPYGGEEMFCIYGIDKNSEDMTRVLECIVYLDDNAQKKGSTEYSEYTLSEYRALYPEYAAKLLSLKNSVAYGGFTGQNAGEIINSAAIPDVATGNGDELVAACGFNEIKWNYIENLFHSSYAK